MNKKFLKTAEVAPTKILTGNMADGDDEKVNLNGTSTKNGSFNSRIGVLTTPRKCWGKCKTGSGNSEELLRKVGMA